MAVEPSFLTPELTLTPIVLAVVHFPAEVAVVALAGDEVLRLLAEVEVEAQPLDAGEEAGQFDVYDLEDGVAVKLVEHHDVVHAVEELGRESAVKRL